MECVYRLRINVLKRRMYSCLLKFLETKLELKIQNNKIIFNKKCYNNTVYTYIGNVREHKIASVIDPSTYSIFNPIFFSLKEGSKPELLTEKKCRQMSQFSQQDVCLSLSSHLP